MDSSYSGRLGLPFLPLCPRRETVIGWKLESGETQMPACWAWQGHAGRKNEHQAAASHLDAGDSARLVGGRKGAVGTVWYLRAH